MGIAEHQFRPRKANGIDYIAIVRTDIRRVMREDDFEWTVDVARIQFGLEVDVRIWEVLVYGDEDLRRAIASETKQSRNNGTPMSSEEFGAIKANRPALARATTRGPTGSLPANGALKITLPKALHVKPMFP